MKLKHKSTSLRARQKNGWKLKSWRKKVKKRDEYKCRQCNTKENLTVHHILAFASSPGSRFDVNNGITLCRTCHDIIDKQIKQGPIVR